jgi:cytochrome c oxidase subunit 3
MTMTAKTHFEDDAKKPMSMHPKKFALWLFLVTVVMIFASLTSYYIVRKSDGNWLEFDLPNYFWINTVIILMSSVTLQWAYLSAKNDQLQKLKLAILLTTILGIAFLVGQYFSWKDLYERGIFFTGASHNVAGSLIYVLSGLHGLHLLGGIIFLIVVLFSSLNYKIHSKNLVQIEMCATYWHFLGLLWVYLFVFLLLNH